MAELEKITLGLSAQQLDFKRFVPSRCDTTQRNPHRADVNMNQDCPKLAKCTDSQFDFDGDSNGAQNKNITKERLNWAPDSPEEMHQECRVLLQPRSLFQAKLAKNSGGLPVRHQDEIRLAKGLGSTANHDPVLAKCRLPMAHPERVRNSRKL
ncbi:hypothetical protein T265_06180 [Opisthorchis viverrini]|uniref:Uncharacterized protein n=1 Tax=Opisthorchis viverrini TaxID=6198 RepID=A0A074ZLD9_OPIVI|nr:hypothetical protein T265_06180 [Opisthorchis viverrini]KER26607.1 hypothetical protein T265_06180 [Opisthorchis viverrini]